MPFWNSADILLKCFKQTLVPIQWKFWEYVGKISKEDF